VVCRPWSLQRTNTLNSCWPHAWRPPPIKSKDRTELIVLITPRVITSSGQARQVTDDYRQQMQLLRPAN